MIARLLQEPQLFEVLSMSFPLVGNPSFIECFENSRKNDSGRAGMTDKELGKFHGLFHKDWR
jgi:hypothetical protein